MNNKLLIKFAISGMCSITAAWAETVVIEDIIGIFQEQIITKSEVDRVLQTYDKRAAISGIIYPPEKNNRKAVTSQILRSLMMRNELKDGPYAIGDKEIDAEVSKLKARLGPDEQALDEFFKSQGLSLREYREIVRDTIEFQTFQQIHIRPSLSEPTDQQIKNRFFNKNQQNTALSYKYVLVQYTLPSNTEMKENLSKIPAQLKDYLITGIIPSHLNGFTQSHWGESKEDSFNQNLRAALKQTDEGSFTPVVNINGEYISYYVEKKDVVESDIFSQEKEKIKNTIYEEEMMKAITQWEERKNSDLFIREF